MTLGRRPRSTCTSSSTFRIGQPAPEIDGVDLDGRPMKLSDYRGKVVAIYFCGPIQLRADATNQPAHGHGIHARAWPSAMRTTHLPCLVSRPSIPVVSADP